MTRAPANRGQALVVSTAAGRRWLPKTSRGHTRFQTEPNGIELAKTTKTPLQTMTDQITEIIADKALRVFVPPSERPRKANIASVPGAFNEFDIAFQNLTGWELRWNGQPAGGKGSASRHAEHAWLSISDLSDRLPPGVPAQSRIYCENLIAKLNRLIAQTSEEYSRNGKHPVKTSASNKKGPSRFQQPCFQELVSIVPIGIENDESVLQGSCDRTIWFFRQSGVVLAGLLDVSGKAELVRTGQMVAKSAFLSASRQLEDSKGLFDNILSTFEQVFDGELQLRLLIWTLDPLLGLGNLCGSEDYQVELDGKPLKACRSSSRGFVWLRGQKLVSFLPGESSEWASGTGWKRCLERSLGNYPPPHWQQALLETTSRSIPAVIDMPEVALAAIRN